MRTVVIESPYKGDEQTNLSYLRAAMADCLQRGEAPFASHGLYTQPGVLRDDVSEERERGISAGFAWRVASEATVVYVDRGLSEGMVAGIRHAIAIGHTIEFRSLPDWATEQGSHIIEVCQMLIDRCRETATPTEQTETSTDPTGLTSVRITSVPIGATGGDFAVADG